MIRSQNRKCGPALTQLFESLLSEGCSCAIRVHGSSMNPFIKNDDVVTISPVSSTRLKVGDVVVVSGGEESSPFIHRMIGRSSRDGNVLLKGDNCLDHDGWMPYASISGVVSGVARNDRARLFGLGPEKKLLAWMSRHGLLYRCIRAAGRRGRISFKRNIVSG